VKHQEPVKHPEAGKNPEPGKRPEKDEPKPTPGLVQPMIDELRRPPKDSVLPQAPQAPPRGPVHPPEPAEQDQDAGGGYNPDHTIPQP
jgi:hypothetical protein